MFKQITLLALIVLNFTSQQVWASISEDEAIDRRARDQIKTSAILRESFFYEEPSVWEISALNRSNYNHYLMNNRDLKKKAERFLTKNYKITASESDKILQSMLNKIDFLKFVDDLPGLPSYPN